MGYNDYTSSSCNKVQFCYIEIICCLMFFSDNNYCGGKNNKQRLEEIANKQIETNNPNI